MAPEHPEEFVGEDFADARLPRQHWQDRHYTGCNFRDADLSELRTERVVFTDCDFTGADLSGSHHTVTAFRSCTFTRTRLWHSVFRSSSLLGSSYQDCRIRPSEFNVVDFTHDSLGKADQR
ncbi:pentapeptide repeat-containing protein, partial [Rhodococcus sp. NPDC058514]|uniref:pentapeptide repeat-containing protein n=1 Tax=Rhodococcus sp. NPDC058514 TaxID=3346532 RepID=UPI003662DE61